MSTGSDSSSKLPKTVLIVTSSGGGGHIQAANAKIHQIKTADPTCKIIVKDLLQKSCGHFWGNQLAILWNSTQKKGYVRFLELLVSATPLYDIIFFLPIFMRTLKNLFLEDVDHIIDTQPLGLSALIHAVRLYNFLQNKNLVIEKILTEFPTKYATHYLEPIKRLSNNNKKLIRLITSPPLLEDDTTDADFWMSFAGLTKKQVLYQDLPIRPSFSQQKNTFKKNDKVLLNIATHTDKEHKLLTSMVNTTLDKINAQKGNICCQIDPSDIVFTLMLGSQPTQKATLAYVQNLINLSRKIDPSTDVWLFVFCSQTKSPPVNLQLTIAKLVKESVDFPKNLRVFPVTSQNDKVIAPLFSRSSVTITRSGGVTAMELMTVANGEICIHKEDKASSFSDLLENSKNLNFLTYRGMPKWEYGNAAYLCHRKGAKMITPESFEKILITTKTLNAYSA